MRSKDIEQNIPWCFEKKSVLPEKLSYDCSRNTLTKTVPGDMAVCNAAGRFQEGYAMGLLYPRILPNRMIAGAYCDMNVNQDDGGIRDGKSGAVQKLLRLKMIN